MRKSLVWISRSCKNSKGLGPSELEPLLTVIHSVFLNRGVTDGIRFVKIVRGNFLNYLSGNKERIPGVKLRKSGIPTCFGPLAEKLEAGLVPTFGLRLILTVLFFTRSLKTQVDPDIDTIVGPSKRCQSTLGIGYLATRFWRELGYFHSGILPRDLRFRRFHFTTRSGPNGHALATWIIDLLLLPERIVEAIKILGGERISTFIDEAKKEESLFKTFVPPKVLVKSKFYIRRIQAFADKEGKTRVIAILDYFSQSVLKGFHRYLFRVLAKIPQDCTFDQSSFKDKITNWNYFCSADLSAATDRFPIQVISEVLRDRKSVV